MMHMNILKETIRAIVDKHAKLTTKILQGNTAPFMNRDLRKGIYTRSTILAKINWDTDKFPCFRDVS